MGKASNILLNKQFVYHKNIPPEECYNLMKIRFNESYEKWKKHFSFSLIQTPFFEKTDREYSFLIGHKSYRRGNKIHGYIEETEGGCIVKIEIRPIFWKMVIFWVIGIFLINTFISDGETVSFVIMSLFMIFGGGTWHMVAGIFFIDHFEKILETI